MSIADLYKSADRTLFSVEVIPPRNGETLEDTVLATLEPLVDFDIAYISVTHHAKNSLKSGTGPIARILEERYGIPVLAHLTCTDATITDIENRLVELKFLGIENILALRGDPPMDQGDFVAHPGGHAHALPLIEQVVGMNNGRYLLRPDDFKRYDLPAGATWRQGAPTDFTIFVAAYPEGHSENPDKDDDLYRLLQKFKAGAKGAIAQITISAQTFLDFERRARKIGIDGYLIAGIRPVTSYDGLVRLAENERFGISVPQDLLDRMGAYKEDKKAMQEIGIEYCVEQCRILLDAGVDGIHFYSMNGKRNVRRVLEEVARSDVKLQVV